MKKCIVTDVDQALLDYGGGLREWYNRRNDTEVVGQALEWDLEKWLDLPEGSTSADIVREFSLHWRFGTLDAYPGSDVILHQFLKNGISLVFLTACGIDPLTKALRNSNLYHRFGEIFEEGHYVAPTDSKVDILRDIKKRYDILAFIDDRPENIIDARVHAGIDNTILMKAPHNRSYRSEHPDEITAHTWYDCKHIINSRFV